MFGLNKNALKVNEVAIDKVELQSLEQKAALLDQFFSRRLARRPRRRIGVTRQQQPIDAADAVHHRRASPSREAYFGEVP